MSERKWDDLQDFTQIAFKCLSFVFGLNKITPKDMMTLGEISVKLINRIYKIVTSQPNTVNIEETAALQFSKAVNVAMKKIREETNIHTERRLLEYYNNVVSADYYNLLDDQIETAVNDAKKEIDGLTNKDIFSVYNKFINTLMHELKHTRYQQYFNLEISTQLDETKRRLDEFIEEMRKNSTNINPKVFLDSMLTPPSELFVGRKKELSLIYQKLEKYSWVNLVGMGGIGKSDTARAYMSENYKKRYDIVQSVTYDGSLFSTISKVRYHFEDNRHSKIDERFDQVINLLNSDNRILLIIDNFNYDLKSYKSNLDEQKYLNILKNSNAHIIFTTRHFYEDSENIQSCEVYIKPLDCEDLKELSLSICPVLSNEFIKNIITSTGNHTLTIILIARLAKKVISYGKKTLADILALLKNKGINNEIDASISNDKDRIQTSKKVYEHIRELFNFNKISKKEKMILASLCLGISENTFSKLLHKKLNIILNDWNYPFEIENLISNGWLQKSGNELIIHPILFEVYINELIKEFEEVYDWIFMNLSNKLDYDEYITIILNSEIILGTEMAKKYFNMSIPKKIKNNINEPFSTVKNYYIYIQNMIAEEIGEKCDFDEAYSPRDSFDKYRLPCKDYRWLDYKTMCKVPNNRRTLHEESIFHLEWQDHSDLMNDIFYYIKPTWKNILKAKNTFENTFSGWWELANWTIENYFKMLIGKIRKPDKKQREEIRAEKGNSLFPGWCNFSLFLKKVEYHYRKEFIHDILFSQIYNINSIINNFCKQHEIDYSFDNEINPFDKLVTTIKQMSFNQALKSEDGLYKLDYIINKNMKKFYLPSFYLKIKDLYSWNFNYYDDCLTLLSPTEDNAHMIVEFITNNSEMIFSCSAMKWLTQYYNNRLTDLLFAQVICNLEYYEEDYILDCYNELKKTNQRFYDYDIKKSNELIKNAKSEKIYLEIYDFIEL